MERIEVHYFQVPFYEKCGWTVHSAHEAGDTYSPRAMVKETNMGKLSRAELIIQAQPLASKIAQAAEKAGVSLIKHENKEENLGIEPALAIAVQLLIIRGLD
jgi:hypothetical protein